MPDRLQITKDVIIGAQPTEAELRAMQEDGVKAVINLRHEGEDLQPIGPEEEGEKVRRLGMVYANVPVSVSRSGPEVVDEFREQLAAAPRPVFVHCKLGRRAGALVLMDRAVREGLSGDETIELARRVGFRFNHEELAAFIREYVDLKHRETSSAA